MKSKPEAKIELTGDWELSVSCGRHAGTVAIRPLAECQAVDEAYARLDDIDETNETHGWWSGTPLRALEAQECTIHRALVPESVQVRAGREAEAATYEAGRDYHVNANGWGAVARLPEGRIGKDQPVFISYRYWPRRLDSVIVTSRGRIAVRRGTPRVAQPVAPKLREGEKRLANIWLSRPAERLTEEDVYPVTEDAYPDPPRTIPTPAQFTLPFFLDKLNHGQTVRILAWGDSVTAGTFTANFPADRWQERFCAFLRERFPKARVELVTEAWGGRTTSSFLEEPPGSEHNYEEKVLAVRPDLLITEFVNDAGLPLDKIKSNYQRIKEDLDRLHIPWIILTPHYVLPLWMNTTTEKGVDDDPRPYTSFVRQFAKEHENILVADAARRYGRLWRQGIPYTTMMVNGINHPNADGLGIFVDALKVLF